MLTAAFYCLLFPSLFLYIACIGKCCTTEWHPSHNIVFCLFKKKNQTPFHSAKFPGRWIGKSQALGSRADLFPSAGESVRDERWYLHIGLDSGLTLLWRSLKTLSALDSVVFE